MTVSLGITDRLTGDHEVVPVATNAAFRSVWLPACQALGLELVPLFADGSLSAVPDDLVPAIARELERLLAHWLASGDAALAGPAERCALLLAALDRVDPARHELDLG